MGLKAFQDEHRIWLNHNFPNQQAHDALLGLIEEVGELAHAHLKAQQGIRGTLEEHHSDAKDAIGDIMIYLASYCNTNGYELAFCLGDAWDEVKDRDWIEYPKNGVSE